MILNLLTGRRVACTHELLGSQKLVPLDLVSDCEAGCVKTEVCDCEAGCVRTLVALIWMSPRIVKSLISRAVKTLHSLLSFAPVSWRATRCISQSREFKFGTAITASDSWRNVARDVCSEDFTLAINCFGHERGLFLLTLIVRLT